MTVTPPPSPPAPPSQTCKMKGRGTEMGKICFQPVCLLRGPIAKKDHSNIRRDEAASSVLCAMPSIVDPWLPCGLSSSAV
jgi:hypothetical protein